MRIGAALLLAYVLGFLAFAVLPPRPAGIEETDAIVVLTGGEGRIDRALDMLRQRKARRLFVAGVDKAVRPGEFASEYEISPATMRCCVTLDYKSTTTTSNASQAAFWIAANRVGSVRLVTSDWHMRRAALELRKVAPPSLAIVEDAVPSRPPLGMLMVEYNKLLARMVGWPT